MTFPQAVMVIVYKSFTILDKKLPEPSTVRLENWSNNMGELHEALKRCLDLNNQRARLIQAFDEKLIDIIKNGGNDDDVMRQHKTY